jgi:hypothetical protein
MFNLETHLFAFVNYENPFDSVKQQMIFSILEDKCIVPNLLLKNVLETYTDPTVKIRANNNATKKDL